jgi:hypothetical protein
LAKTVDVVTDATSGRPAPHRTTVPQSIFERHSGREQRPPVFAGDASRLDAVVTVGRGALLFL